MNASTKGKRPLRHLTASDKINAIQRINSGESKASVSRDTGVPESTLRGWCKKEENIRRIVMSNNLENKLTVDKLSERAGTYGVKPEKRQKLEHSLPLNFESNGKIMYEDMSYRNSLGSIDFGGYNGRSDLASISSLQCDENMIRGYGADAKQNHPRKPNISMAAISPSTSFSNLLGVLGSGFSFNGIASNLLAQQYSNQAAVAKLANSENNALHTARPKLSHSLTEAKLQQNSLTMDNISMAGDMIDKPKKPSSASLSRDPPNEEALTLKRLLKRQKMLNLNTLYSAVPPSASPNRLSSLQLKPPSMIPAAIPTPSPVWSIPQTTSSKPWGTSNGIKNTQRFWQWCKLNQLNDAMKTEKFNSNNMLSSQFKDMTGYSTNNNNNVNKPEDLSKSSHRSSLVNKTSEVSDTITSSTQSLAAEQKFPVDDNEKGQSNVRSKLDTLLCNNNNKDVKVKIEQDYSELSGPEAVEHGEKFLAWLNSYSDPSITAMQVMQFKYLFERIKSSVERKNNPNSNVGSSKKRKRK